ncbi:MAG: TetR family transcriptional regulator [Bdellovibrionota bacterium]
MVLKKVKSSDLKDLDTCQRIRETAINLFALKGFEGASIREIARIACVNVAAINYHFKSKENLREEITEMIVLDFKEKISTITDAASMSEYSVKIFRALSEDPAKCVNQFKLILEADTGAFDQDPYPVGYEQFSIHMNKELSKSVPQEERLWLVHAVMSYVVHTAIMSSTKIGKRTVKKFFGGHPVTLEDYISRMVNGLIRDLNSRYS